MKKNYLFILSLLLFVSIFSQEVSTLEWKKDLETLKNRLLEKDYLFYRFSKNEFQLEIEELKNRVSVLNLDEIQWNIHKILSHFKLFDLHLENVNSIRFPLELKVFQDNYYVTSIYKENSYLLGYKLIKIGDFNINEIVNKMKTVFYLPHKNQIEKTLVKYLNNKSLLRYLNIYKKDTLKFTFKSQDNTIETINLPVFKDLDKETLAVIKPRNKLFYQRKNWVWFWKYGINFGKQVFLKYQVCSSKEHINKTLDSLNISEKEYAKAYKLPLQKVYDAKELQPFLETVVEKFEKKRYKKLIIDLRDNTKGAFLSATELIYRVKKIKRINKKGKLFILTNTNINAAAIKIILEFQEKTNALIVGETIFGTKEDSNKNSFFTLPNSNFKINYPTILKQEIKIKPNIKVEPTFKQYKNGIDALLQKVLDY